MLASMVGLRAVTGLLAVAGAVPPITASAPGCATEPAPAAVIAETPWPQQRFDLDTLRQITDGAGVSVAVVDSGVRAEHPQLGTAVRAGFDLLDQGGQGRVDCVGHGTAVASIIAARPVPGMGLRGVAPAARILPVRVSERVDGTGLDRAGSRAGPEEVADLAAGIRAATASRPKPAVINLSIASARDDARLRQAVRAAVAADIVVVAAVGNWYEQGSPTPFPASYDGVVGVGAIGRDGRRVPSSSVGPYVDLTAPGDEVVAAAGRGGHARFQGTSFATPFVAGTAALIRARWPNLTAAQVIRRLIATADPAPGGPAEYGQGVLNPVRALTEVLGSGPLGSGPHGSAPHGSEPHGSAPAPHPLAPGMRDAPPATGAVGAAAALVGLAVAVTVAALAIPRGRRRRWRPDPR